MGVALGTIIGFIGAGILIIPIIIDFVVANEVNRDSLRAAGALTIIGGFFLVIGMLIAAFASGKETIKAGGDILKENPQLASLLLAAV